MLHDNYRHTPAVCPPLVRPYPSTRQATALARRLLRPVFAALFPAIAKLAKLAMLTMLATTGVHAAEPNQTVAPDKLVTQVLEQNAGLAALRAAVDAAELRILPAGALPDPRFLGAVAPRTLDGFTTPSGQERGVSGILALSQELPWPGTLGLREDVARYQSQAAVDDVKALRLRLESATLASYAQWAYVHKALDINAANQQLTDELRRVAENRYAVGIAQQQDVLQAEVRLQQLKQQALEFKRRKAEVQARLNALLNRDANLPLPPPTALPWPQDLPDYAALRELALARHPELMQINKRLAANGARETLAEKGFYPNLQFEVRNNDFRPASQTRLQVGVSLSLPLNRDKYRAELDAAHADGTRLRFELDDRRAQLLGELESARVATQVGAETIALYREQLIPRTRENLSAARSAYGSGGGSFLDVITAETQKLSAQLNLEKARANYFAARAELARWAGGSLSAVTPPPKATLAEQTTPRAYYEKP